MRRRTWEAIQTIDGSTYVEDVGGSTGTGPNNRARRPNSFVYRFLPNDPSNLRAGGKFQALQVSVAPTFSLQFRRP